MAATLLQIEGFDILADAANLAAKNYTNGSYATRDVVAGRYEGSALRLRYQEIFAATVSTQYCPRTNRLLFSSGGQLEGCVGFAFKTDNMIIGVSSTNPTNSNIFFNLKNGSLPFLALGVQSGYVSIYNGGSFYNQDSVALGGVNTASYRDFYAIQDSSGVLGTTQTPALSTGVYSYIELEYKIHPLSGYTNLYIDNRQYISYTGAVGPFASGSVNTYEFNASPASITSSTSTKFAGTGASDASFGTYAWTTPEAITAEDAGNATSVLFSIGTTSRYLKGTNFGFSIPTNATILGIEVKFLRSCSANVSDSRVRIIKGGVVSTTDLFSGAGWSAGSVLRWDTYGSSSNLWGETWTPADINASNFGVVLAAVGTASTVTVQVDAFKIVVYYQNNPSNYIAEYNLANGYWINNHFDDFYYSSITGSGQHYGPSRIKSMHATGIILQEWMNTGGLVPGVVSTNDGDTSYMDDAITANPTDYYGMANFIPTASGLIKGIDSITVGKGSSTIGPLVNITGINYIGPNHTFTGSYLYYENLWRNKPNTGVDWQHSDVAGNYWGYKRLA